MRRQTWAGGLALLALLALPLTAFGAYPPGSFPGPAPGGAYRTIVMSQMVCAAGGQMEASYDQSALTLVIPQGAFGSCTQVSIYVAEPGVISPLLPAGAELVDGFAVGWDPTGPTAATLSLTIADAAIAADAQVFETTSSGMRRSAAASVEAGAVTLGFTTPQGVVVAITGTAGASPSVAGSASPSPSSAVLGATSSPAITAPPAAGGPVVKIPPTDMSGPILVLLILSFLVLAILLRRRRRTAPAG